LAVPAARAAGEAVTALKVMLVVVLSVVTEYEVDVSFEEAE